MIATIGKMDERGIPTLEPDGMREYKCWLCERTFNSVNPDVHLDKGRHDLVGCFFCHWKDYRWRFMEVADKECLTMREQETGRSVANIT